MAMHRHLRGTRSQMSTGASRVLGGGVERRGKDMEVRLRSCGSNEQALKAMHVQ